MHILNLVILAHEGGVHLIQLVHLDQLDVGHNLVLGAEVHTVL